MPRGVFYFIAAVTVVMIVAGYFGVGQLPWR
jgi:hypothetical protein